MDIGTFSVNFLAEIGLDSFIVTFMYLFTYEGKKWKLPLIVYVPVMSLFYLHLIKIPTIWSLVAWCLLIPCGLLIFVKNIQATAYSSILFPNSKLDSSEMKKEEKQVDGKEEDTKVSIEDRIKSIESVNYTILTAVIIGAFASESQNFPAITQVPIFWIILFSTLGLLIYYKFTNRKSIENNLMVSLKVFLASTYLLMGLSFTSVYFYLTNITHLPLLYSLTFACITVMAVFAFNTYIFDKTKKAILESEKNTEILAKFIWILNQSKLINLTFIIALSDFPIVIGLMLTQNTELMWMWTIGFFVFIGSWLRGTIKDNELLRIQANLTDEGELRGKYKDLV